MKAIFIFPGFGSYKKAAMNFFAEFSLWLHVFFLKYIQELQLIFGMLSKHLAF